MAKDKGKSWEGCPKCGNTVRIPSNKPTKCPKCNALIYPCSRCKVTDCNLCPYTKTTSSQQIPSGTQGVV